MVNFFKGTKITEHTDITDLFLLKNLKVASYKKRNHKDRSKSAGCLVQMTILQPEADFVVQDSS